VRLLPLAIPPRVASDHGPSSLPPRPFSHFWIRRRMRGSMTRCWMNRTSQCCARVSKKLGMSQSSTKFTRFRVRATESASRACCGLRPGRNP
jgi:hypothetical protein